MEIVFFIYAFLITCPIATGIVVAALWWAFGGRRGRIRERRIFRNS